MAGGRTVGPVPWVPRLVVWGGLCSLLGCGAPLPLDPFGNEPTVFVAVVAPGARHTCAVDLGGVAYCWGQGEGAGLPADSVVTQPRPVDNTLRFLTIGAGNDFTCGIVGQVEPYCWGLNEAGQLGDSTTTTRTAPGPVTDGLEAATLSSGGRHTCAYSADGIWCWGAGHFTGDGADGVSIIPKRVSGELSPFDVGSDHACGINGFGVGFCWGENLDGQLGTGNLEPGVEPQSLGTLSARFSSISAGDRRTCAVLIDGRGVCWGRPWLGDGSDSSSTSPVLVNHEDGFRQISTGGDMSCGITISNRLYCWGLGGRLGDGAVADALTPSRVAGDIKFIDVKVGESHACGIANKNVLYCWGSNASGQLGIGSRADALEPVVVAFPPAGL